MSAIINAILQHKAGQAVSSQQEINHVGPTTGHHETAGGLRGHSIDQETYPWRVVGHPGNAWSVVGADSVVADRIDFSSYLGTRQLLSEPYTLEDLDDLACSEAHDLARHLKAYHPSGRI